MTVLCYQAYLSALCSENRQDTDRTCSILENQMRRKPELADRLDAHEPVGAL